MVRTRKPVNPWPSGQGTDQVVTAAMKPIRQKTGANARSLIKRGYKKR